MTSSAVVSHTRKPADPEAHAKKLVLHEVRSSREPLGPDTVLEAIRKAEPNLAFLTLQAAIWELVRERTLEFTNDWRLRVRA